MRLYRYLGPAEIPQMLQSSGGCDTERQTVRSAEDVKRLSQALYDGHVNTLTCTFVVDAEGTLWRADRHSEHVACARGEVVQAAGEMTFSLRPAVQILEVTNRSTGYCPEPSSYFAVASALSKASIPYPADYTHRFEFRRCGGCELLNIVKDEDYVCAQCEAPLSSTWDCEPAIA